MNDRTAERWRLKAPVTDNLLATRRVELGGETWLLVDVAGHGVYWCNRGRQVRWAYSLVRREAVK